MNVLNIRSYFGGLFASALLIVFSYALASFPSIPQPWRDAGIALLAIAQVWVFLFLFLGLGKEAKPRWNILIFLFMSLVCAILVIGSIWIMYHLDYNLMMSHD